MRALFEASVYVDWILHSDADCKAMYFYVSNLRKERIWNYRTQSGHPEHDTFFESLGSFGHTLEETKNRFSQESKQRIDEIETHLSKNEWAEVNQALEDSKGSRKHEPAWYKPLGANSFRQVARGMNRLHEYEIFYSQASEKMHGSEYKSHIRFSSGLVTLEPIKNLEGLTTTISYSVAATFHTYRTIISHYRPNQIEEFKQKYIEHWRNPFMNMPNVKYKSDASEPIL